MHVSNVFLIFIYGLILGAVMDFLHVFIIYCKSLWRYRYDDMVMVPCKFLKDNYGHAYMIVVKQNLILNGGNF